MVGEESHIIRLRDDFYRDGFRKVFISLCIIVAAMVLVAGTSIFIYTQKPQPVTFYTEEEWRVLAPVPVNEPYLSGAEIHQWVSSTLQTVFTYDFVNYNHQLKSYKSHFTDNGWKIFHDFLNNYAKEETVRTSRLFVHSNAIEAPEITSYGPQRDGRYAWWVQMKLKVNYINAEKIYSSKESVLRVLVVRVPTVGNLSGVAIENILLATR